MNIRWKIRMLAWLNCIVGVFAGRSHRGLYLAAVVGVLDLLYVLVSHTCRHYESLWAFVLLAPLMLPINFMRVPAWFRMILDPTSIGMVLLGEVLIFALFSVEMLVLQILIRCLRRHQSAVGVEVDNVLNI